MVGHIDMRAFIVTTVRDPGPPLLSFLRYHLRIGFAHIFLYFDDPCDPWITAASQVPGVTVIPCTPELREAQRSLGGTFEAMGPFITKEVMARQILNAEHALGLARELGADWLLHLDVDELFHSAEPVASHFSCIAPDVGQVVYLNYEAFPEHSDLEDYFREVTLFKRHPSLCSERALRGWLGATNRRWYFLNYDNGKAAVRPVPGTAARSVHIFTTAMTCPKTTLTVDPCILHYANCGFRYFRRKYLQRGSFSDRYFEQRPRLPFHLASRDLFAEDSLVEQRAFYERHVVCSEERDLELLMEAGLGVRLTDARVVLEGVNR
jgi:hypothetical protein